MAAAVIIEAVSQLGVSVFDYFGKKQDGKNLEQIGLNDSFQSYQNFFPNPYADNGQSNLKIILFGIVIILIAAIVIIKYNKGE